MLRSKKVLIILRLALFSVPCVFAVGTFADNDAGSALNSSGLNPTAFNLGVPNPDPWKNTNQKIYRFNSYFDKLILRPVAKTYDTALPRVVRQGIGNFLSNIDDVNVFVNDLLQLKFGDAITDSGRFLINTTIGLAGVLDIASDMGLAKHEEDFGQTFAHWNIGSGPYVVIPILGPASVRDSVGLVLDLVFNPLQYQDDTSLNALYLVTDQVDGRASVLAIEELIIGDEYTFVRDAYLQRRVYLSKDGEVEDFFDF